MTTAADLAAPSDHAARIVGTSDEKAQKWVADHLKKMDDENMAKEARLQQEGWSAYKKLDT